MRHWQASAVNHAVQVAALTVPHCQVWHHCRQYRWAACCAVESPAAEAGLMMNDCIVRINGQNVSRSTAESVARLVRYKPIMTVAWLFIKTSWLNRLADVASRDQYFFNTDSSNSKCQYALQSADLRSLVLFSLGSYICIHGYVKKGFPYSLLSVGPGADPGVQAVSPQVTDYKSSTRR